ncbi:hypothetical protein JCM3770_002560 [Rhodotorula araucariae]
MPVSVAGEAAVFSSSDSFKLRIDAIEALDFAVRGKVTPMLETQDLDKLPEVYERMEKGAVAGRIVLKC